MPADYTLKQGDTEPIFYDSLTYSDGTQVNLEGASLKFIMRSLTAAEPVKLTGTPAIATAKEGKVTYTPSALDSSTPGSYLANWRVTFAGGEVMTFPTEGYLSVEVQENLTSETERQLLSVGQVKDYLNIPSNDHAHDWKLKRWINSVRPLIEFVTGPIIPEKFDEWYDGGHPWISLRHRPRTGNGTTPLLTIAACSEYLGPVEWPLAIISSPDQGQLYSCMADIRLGRVVRRTAGGGVQPFPNQPQAVHVIYEAGQQQVPENVELAALETLAWWFSTQQPIGRGRMRPADDEGGKPMVGLPYHALSILGPTKRIKGIA